MSDYKTLVRGPFGMIRRCPCCDTWNLIFQNISLEMNREGFHQFKEQIGACYRRGLDSGKPAPARHIVIQTPMDACKFLFSTREASALLCMMQAAELQVLAEEKL